LRSILIRGAIALAGVALAWLVGARQLSLLLDRLFTPRLYALPVSSLSYSLDTLWIGQFPLDLQTDVRVSSVSISCESRNRVVLSSGGRFFAMGVCTGRDTKGTGEFKFIPDSGDNVSLVVDRSIVSWPTPLEMNFMTGQSPSWKRNVYYRLAWNKASGAKLVMVWHFEQGFYPNGGWTSSTMTREGSTGLLQVDVVDSR